MSDLENTVEKGSEQGLQPSESVDTTSADFSESNVDTGQADESSSQTGKEQVVAGLPEGMTPEKLQESYKSLQAEFTTNQQGFKDLQNQMGQLDQYGGLEKVVQLANWLNTNPRFNEFVKTETDRANLGDQYVDPNENAEMANAKKIVADISQTVANHAIEQAMREKVEPLADQLKEQLIEESMGQMDKKYGNSWHDMRDTMSELAKDKPASVQDNPTFKDMEMLYVEALMESGKFVDFAAGEHQKLLVEKKKTSTESPGTTGGVTQKSVSNMTQALKQAEKTHGITLA